MSSTDRQNHAIALQNLDSHIAGRVLAKLPPRLVSTPIVAFSLLSVPRTAMVSLRTLLLASLAAPFLVLAAALLLLAGWLAYLKFLALSDPLKHLPGSHEGTVQQADEDFEGWAREHANAPCNGKTPRNLRLPGLFPVRAITLPKTQLTIVQFEGRLRLLTADRRVISHILSSPSAPIDAANQ